VERVRSELRAESSGTSPMGAVVKHSPSAHPAPQPKPNPFFSASSPGSNGSQSATYEQLEAITCDLSAFPQCQFFRVEVRADEGLVGSTAGWVGVDGVALTRLVWGPCGEEAHPSKKTQGPLKRLITPPTTNNLLSQPEGHRKAVAHSLCDPGPERGGHPRHDGQGCQGGGHAGR